MQPPACKRRQGTLQAQRLQRIGEKPDCQSGEEGRNDEHWRESDADGGGKEAGPGERPESRTGEKIHGEQPLKEDDGSAVRNLYAEPALEQGGAQYLAAGRRRHEACSVPVV